MRWGADHRAKKCRVRGDAIGRPCCLGAGSGASICRVFFGVGAMEKKGRPAAEAVVMETCPGRIVMNGCEQCTGCGACGNSRPVCRKQKTAYVRFFCSWSYFTSAALVDATTGALVRSTIFAKVFGEVLAISARTFRSSWIFALLSPSMNLL